MANKIMTVLEGHATADKWAALVNGFAQMDSQRPPGLEATYLMQSTGDPTLWRTVGIWASQQAFDAFRTAVVTPPPLALFLSLGVQPTLSLFEIKG
jgi:heme-degrading monooxygenase HmoA